MKYASDLCLTCNVASLCSDSSAKLSSLTLEMSDAAQREVELKQKFKEIYVKEKNRADIAEEKVKGWQRTWI